LLELAFPLLKKVPERRALSEPRLNHGKADQNNQAAKDRSRVPKGGRWHDLSFYLSGICMAVVCPTARIVEPGDLLLVLEAKMQNEIRADAALGTGSLTL
jgi:biotin carboxyl carrier protein